MRVVVRSAACACALALVAARPAAASPMSDAIVALACRDSARAEAALTTLATAPRSAFGVPDESLTGSDVELASATVDTLLDALANARQRFPALAPRIDELVESWDFCAVTSGGSRWDLAAGEVLLGRAPAILAPLGGRGFAVWGLLPRVARGRPRWQAERAMAPETLPPQCGPSPLTLTTPHGPLPMLPPPSPAGDVTCLGPPPPAPDAALAPPPPAPALPRRAAGKLDPRAAPPRRATPSSPPDDTHEVASDATREAVSPLPGTVSVNATLSMRGASSTGAAISLAPWRNTFVRAGASWRMMSQWSEALSLEPTWSWGLGYDDWRTGTFSLQLNHWGPLRRWPGAAVWRGAVLAAGYKVPLGKQLGKRFSLRVDLTTPLSWAPALGVGGSVKLPYFCFASVGVAQRLEAGAGPTWTYTLGHSQWKPGTLSIILANYGPNALGEPNLPNLALTVSWSWKL